MVWFLNRFNRRKEVHSLALSPLNFYTYPYMDIHKLHNNSGKFTLCFPSQKLQYVNHTFMVHNVCYECIILKSDIAKSISLPYTIWTNHRHYRLSHPLSLLFHSYCGLILDRFRKYILTRHKWNFIMTFLQK